MTRLRASPAREDRDLADALADDFDYEGITTCAGDSICQTACPVKIDTGALVKELKAAAHPAAARGAAVAAAEHFVGGGARRAGRPRRRERGAGGAARRARRRGGERPAARRAADARPGDPAGDGAAAAGARAADGRTRRDASAPSSTSRAA